MAWVFFQVFLAFGVGVLIVWWTWPKSKKSDKAAGSSADTADRGKKLAMHANKYGSANTSLPA